MFLDIHSTNVYISMTKVMVTVIILNIAMKYAFHSNMLCKFDAKVPKTVFKYVFRIISIRIDINKYSFIMQINLLFLSKKLFEMKSY